MAIEWVTIGDCTLHCGDALAVLRTLPDGMARCCVTSPPYFGLRSYDENAVVIDPALDDETRAWLLSELLKRDIHAR